MHSLSAHDTSIPHIHTYAQKQQVQVEPAFWWAGMKHPQLQLMLRGDKIGDRLVSISAPHITIDSIVSGDPSAGRLSIDMQQGEVKHIYTPDNKTSDYLFIYLNIAHAQAGKFTISLRTKARGKSIELPYELKKRQLAHGAQGFDSSDVVYLIMPDRFANGDGTNDRSQRVKHPDILDRKAQGDRHGGDLMGIMHRLGYLDSLGVTSLWLTPVQTNDMGRGSYHGYAITDYYRIDPRLGDNKLYCKLIQQAHQRGMKVIMDAVFNHCGALHPWITNLPFRDWINSSDSYVNTNHVKSCYYDPYTSRRDSTAFTDGWFVPSMPDLNQKNPHLATYLIQNSIWWIEYAGIDGIRQDTYPYPYAPMMAEWCRRVMHEYPHFNIVGEA
ncbi:alpha-amylase family glycosyl hydrolase [Porphyromonas pogonae]|uniref:alpha-amylase family glycosyl hydrolase n=1 Tax=Porphyromonas pogonae TaxID=867595 RepID=UPI0038B51221